MLITKNMRTTKSSHGKAGTHTLPVEQFLRQFEGGQEETVIKLENFFRVGGGASSLAPHVVILTSFIHYWSYQ